MTAPEAAPAALPAWRAWWLAARPRTLTASITPVAIGTALAINAGVFRWPAALAALAGGLLIQIGTNFANDVLDHRRGADTAERLGPTRVVQAGLLSDRAVARGAAAAFGLAMLVGLYLVRAGGWPIALLGVVSIASGVLYTAGPYPLAYVGLGDVFVMLFFGLAAVTGTYYVQAGELHPAAIPLGVAAGALSVAILTVNNLRDRDTDGRAGKRTLAVRLGDARTRRYYGVMLGLAFVVPLAQVVAGALATPPAWALGPGAGLVLLALPAANAPLRLVRAGAAGAALNPVLGLTARAQLWHTVWLCAGLVADGFVRGWVAGGG